MYSSWEISSFYGFHSYIDSIDPHIIILGPVYSPDHQPCAPQTLQIPQVWNEIQHVFSPQCATSLEFTVLVNPTNIFSVTQARNLNIVLDASSGFLVLPTPYLVSSHVFLTVVPILCISFFLCQLPCSYAGLHILSSTLLKSCPTCSCCLWDLNPFMPFVTLLLKSYDSKAQLWLCLSTPKASVISISDKSSNFLSILTHWALFHSCFW